MFLLFLSLMTSVHASCPVGADVDLRQSHPEVFNKLSIQDQGRDGLCYAYAASFLYDFHRIHRKSDGYDRKRTDPVAAAIFSSVLTADESIEGGEICEVVNGISKSGYACENSGIIFSQIQGLGSELQIKLVDIVLPYLNREKLFIPVSPLFVDSGFRKKNIKKLDSNQVVFLDRMLKLIEELEIDLQMRYLKDRIPDRKRLFEFLQNTYVENTWAGFEASFALLLAEKSCATSRFEVPQLSCSSYEGRSLYRIVDNALNFKMPAGVSLCATVFSQKNYRGIGPGQKHAPDCAEHAVAVIGRRNYYGTCQYLIRNSWGTNRRYPWPVSNGDIWVDESALGANTFRVSTVQ